MSPAGRRVAVLLPLLVLSIGAGISLLRDRAIAPAALPRLAAPQWRGDLGRERLYSELQPVRLQNCTLQRFGEPHDGGYLMCGNLLDGAQAGYSYGISGYDGWGCQISQRLGVPVHQYDCFDLTRPACPDGDTRFHAECIAASASKDSEGRPFDTLANQLARNGHAGVNVIVKMDVEGAEWESLLGAPDEVLERIDQLAVEFHGAGADEMTYLAAVSRLKTFFHVAHLHFNNYSCTEGLAPFPAWAYEVLFVNRRLARVDPDGGEVTRPHPLDAPNNPEAPDCQYAPREANR